MKEKLLAWLDSFAFVWIVGLFLITIGCLLYRYVEYLSVFKALFR